MRYSQRYNHHRRRVELHQEDLVSNVLQGTSDTRRILAVVKY